MNRKPDSAPLAERLITQPGRSFGGGSALWLGSGDG